MAEYDELFEEEKPEEEEPTEISRLVYLLTRYKIQIPKSLRNYLPGSDWLSQLHDGLTTVTAEFPYPIATLSDLYRSGESMGTGSPREGIILLAKMIDANLLNNGIPLTERSKVYSLLDRFITSETMLEEVEVNLANPPPISHIPKWDTGFLPLDVVTGGVYQGIFVVVGRPGMGKTSLMLSMMESVVQTHEYSVLFVQNEIPSDAMVGRMHPILSRTRFKETDRLICASWSSQDILDWVKDHPDPNRVIFFDSPDVVASNKGEERRFVLEKQFQDMVRLKRMSKLVICSSQPKQRDAVVTLTSMAESWQKAWFADCICGIGVERARGAIPTLRLSVVKNRFGPVGGEYAFKYDYEDLSWEISESEMDSEGVW